MFLRIGRSCAAVATDMKAAVSARICRPDLYPLEAPPRAPELYPLEAPRRAPPLWVLADTRRSPLMYPREGLGYHRFSTINMPIMKRQVLADRRIPLMYPREGLGYRRFYTINRPTMKRQEVVGTNISLMYPPAALGYRCFSIMIEKPIKSQSSFKRIISIAKLKALKESVEKLLLYAKTVSIPIFKQVSCLVSQAIRTIWLFVTGLVWEYLRHVKKGFEDQVSQYHFLTFVAIISTFLVYLIERFNLSSYLGFLFKDAKECPIDVLAKEMRDIESKLNEQAELSEQDRQTFINRLTEVASEVQMAIPELSGLKVRADRLEVCIEELQNELMKLKEKEEK